MTPLTSRRSFLKVAGATAAATCIPWLKCSAPPDKPNVVVVFCDDLGYGDLSTFGHPTLHTPNLDRMAANGQKWTNFYAAASVCTPSRAGLVTGRYPIRSGMCSSKRRVLFPDSASGLPQNEVTIAEALKKEGYHTACFGKWHLGHLPEYLPTSHGFDTYFGIPYSNDMDKLQRLTLEDQLDPQVEDYNVPLMRDEDVVERPANQHTIVRRYTNETIDFIKQHKDEPFFVYLAHNLPHIPLFTNDKFRNTSERGLYGDVVEEIDYGVGEIEKTLKELNLEKRTLIVFTSDNGPWLPFREHGGSAGLLRQGKGTTWEGGMREPTIFYWPEKIKPGVVMDMGSTLDLFATIASISDAKCPDDRVMDSLDLTPTLFENKPSPRKTMFYYRGTELYAVRKGPYKAHFITELCYQEDNNRQEHDPPLLFHLDHDPSEKYNIADKHPEVLEDIQKEVEKHRANLEPGEDQLVKRIE